MVICLYSVKNMRKLVGLSLKKVVGNLYNAQAMHLKNTDRILPPVWQTHPLLKLFKYHQLVRIRNKIQVSNSTLTQASLKGGIDGPLHPSTIILSGTDRVRLLEVLE